MIASISGVLTHKSPQYLIVDIHGIGFQIYTSLQSFYRLPELKESVLLHTYTHLREDTLELYGFITPAERETFTVLLSVSGIGPRSAINILSGLSVPDLVKAIQEGDVRRLQSVPSIGAKTAGRLTLELKDKLTGLSGISGTVEQRPAPDRQHERTGEDAVSALVNLGYPRQRVKEVVEQVCQDGSATSPDTSPNLEDLIKKALKMLSR